MVMATLYYYGAQGRGQQIRYALAQAGIEWVDDNEAFPPSEDAKAKWKAAGGLNATTNVPMLVIDGKASHTSLAAARTSFSLLSLR